MRIGIDLGGTKIEGIALAGDGAELVRERVPTPREDYAGTIETLVKLVQRLEEAAGEPGTVGVGMPGTVSPRTGLVRGANTTWLQERRFDHDLGDALGRPVRCANDANCLALSEAADGAAAGEQVVLGIILGSGAGAGVIVNEQIVEGRTGSVGEWGHNFLPWPSADEVPGPRCWCGRDGCIEAWLSGPALERQYRAATGEVLPAESLAMAAADGNEVARALLDRFAERLARGLAHVVNILDPNVVVFGGGVSNIDHIYRVVPGLLGQWLFSGETDVPLRQALHGDASGVRGAARLWPAQD